MGPALFVRNHDQYLRRMRGRPALFRASFRWTGAAKALQEAGPGGLPVYFSPIPDRLASEMNRTERGRVDYVGRLIALCLDPTPADIPRLLEETGALDIASRRADAPEGGEGLWDGDCKTLYVATVHPLVGEQRFPMTELVKLSDGEPIHEDYGYAYSLVRARSGDPLD